MYRLTHTITEAIRHKTMLDKNLATANRSRVSCAHNTLRTSIGLNITLWPWNLG